MCPVAAKSKNSNPISKNKIHKKIDSNLENGPEDEKIAQDQKLIQNSQQNHIDDKGGIENDDEFKAIYTSSTANNNQATISTSDGNNGYAKLHIGSNLIESTLSVNGITTLTGALDANSTADIADTLTLSKDSGTGLTVTSNATVGCVLPIPTRLFASSKKKKPS